jgi:phosphonopyruvate decarboxylase
MSTATLGVQTQLRASTFAGHLKERGYRFFAGVPCSYFKHAIDEISADSAFTYVGAANEGAALALCAGAATAGTKAACLLQNSGFGNLVNPLTSLSLTYGIPTLLFISMRAFPDWTTDEPQHSIMGKTLPSILDAVGVPYWVMPRDPDAFAQALAAADEVIEAGRIAALLIEKGAMTGAAVPAARSDLPLSRIEAIRIVTEEIPRDAVVISTAGMISRELFAAADRPHNFYMQGSMGHAMAMGLGVALTTSSMTPVVILDGDGAALMHMGTMATIGDRRPKRFLHVIIDNEAYGTTGNQLTAAATTRLDAVAAACGYAAVAQCDDATKVRAFITEFCAIEGPTCLVVKVNRRDMDQTPRITSVYTPEQTTAQVRRAIASCQRTN